MTTNLFIALNCFMRDIWIIIKAKKFQLFTGDIDQIMVKSHILTKKNIEH